MQAYIGPKNSFAAHLAKMGMVWTLKTYTRLGYRPTLKDTGLLRFNKNHIFGAPYIKN